MRLDGSATPPSNATPAPPSGKKILWWIGRVLIGFGIALIAIIVTGIVYQAIGETADARRYPPPGELIEVGGYQLHISCKGDGEPSVILEALSGGMSSYWAWVQPELAKITRVCAYDRAGRGWSDAGRAVDASYADQRIQELHTLLENAGISEPYLLVGHSIGGIYMLLYTEQYEDQVAGVVLLDSSHPEQYHRVPGMEAENQAFLQQSAIFPWLARVGLFRLYFSTGGELDFRDLPERQHAEVASLWSSPRYFASQRAEILAAPDIFERGQSLDNLGDLPLLVITAGEQSTSMWGELQAELASLSSNSLHLTLTEATHTSLIFNPEHASQVSEAIIDMVRRIRTGIAAR